MVVVNQSGKSFFSIFRRRNSSDTAAMNSWTEGQEHHSGSFAERLIADGSRTAAEALAQQIGTGIELAGRRKDGSEFPIELMLSHWKTPRNLGDGGESATSACARLRKIIWRG